MIKNKKSLYILLPLTLLLWAYIIYRVLEGTASQLKEPVLSDIPSSRETPSFQPDSFELILDYPDPFLGRQTDPSPPAPTVKASPKPAVVKAPPKVEKVNWPAIQYIGRIANRVSDKEVHILNIAGEEYVVAEGDQVKQIQVLAFRQDSVLLQLAHEKKSIPKK